MSPAPNRSGPTSPWRGAAASSNEAIEGVLEGPGPLHLHYGGTLERPRLAWRLEGRAGAPVVVALGGISAHRRVFDLQQPRAGWWSELAGPDRALDSRRVRILGIDYLGGSGESSHPEPGSSFPALSSYDQAEALVRLLDQLGLSRVRAIAGASYGGMVALAFAQRHAERVERLLVISAADRPHPMATAWRSVQRRTVRFALDVGQPERGLELARALAMTTYRSAEEFAARFDRPPRPGLGPLAGEFVFPVEEYLYARGRDYAARYRAESFLCLSESIDLHRVDVGQIEVPATVVAVREDQLVPIADMRALAARMPRARLHELSSPCGHDAFLKEAGQLLPIFERLYGSPE